LQDLGVRYVMLRTTEAKAEAAAHPELVFIASSAPWDIYLVQHSDIVVPLDAQPVVVRGRSGDRRERNLELGTSWFQHPDEWAAMPADDGPDEWQRISVQVDLTRREGVSGEPGRRVDIVTPVEPIERVALPAVAISNVEIEQQSLSFDVDQVGVPVLVRVGYFPNWKVSGADGPYRVGPNMMVVVPESTHVVLDYGRSMVDWITILLTLAGIGLCVFWRRQGDVQHAAEHPVGILGSIAAKSGHELDTLAGTTPDIDAVEQANTWSAGDGGRVPPPSDWSWMASTTDATEPGLDEPGQDALGPPVPPR